MTKVIRFMHKVPPYRAGETAGFPDAEAQRLIDLGAAVPVDEGKPTDSAPTGYARSDMAASPADRQMRAKAKGKRG